MVPVPTAMHSSVRCRKPPLPVRAGCKQKPSACISQLSAIPLRNAGRPLLASSCSLVLPASHTSQKNASHWSWKPPSLAWGRCCTSLSQKGLRDVKALAVDAVQLGALVEFKKNDKAVLGVVAQPDGKKNWWVVDKAVTLVLPGPYAEPDVAGFLNAAAAAAASVDDDAMSIAWELASERAGGMHMQELADLLLSDTSPHSIYSMHRLLQEDKIYFKQSKRDASLYEARPAEAVAASKRALEAQRLVEEMKRKQQEELAAWKTFVTEAMAKPHGSKLSRQELLAGPYGERIQAVRQLAVRGDEAGEAVLELAGKTLQAIGHATTFSGAWSLLVELGFWRRHEQAQLLRAGLRDEFGDMLESEAQALARSPQPDPDAANRLDLTYLNSYTIDDASTTEVDDAISVERLPAAAASGTGDSGGGWRLWVHVADPTRMMGMASDVAQEAARRHRTLYLPAGKLPMFPLTLAEGPFSLRSGCVCPTLSFSATLNDDGSINTNDMRVVPALVRITHKLTYEQVDGLLQDGEDEDLTAAFAATLKRTAWRMGEGAVDINLPQALLAVDPSQLDAVRPVLTLQTIRRTPSRQLVEEFMVMAGEIAGRIGAQRKLPLPYRSQQQPDLPSKEELDKLPHEYCLAFARRCCMRRADIQAAGPQRHASLGVEHYVQVTSPIRRYADMLAHWQLKASLRGDKAPLSEAAMQAALDAAAETDRVMREVEREVEAYWMAEFCRQAALAKRTFKGLFLGWGLRGGAELATILLEDLGLEVLAQLSPDSGLQPGSRLLVQPEKLNRQDVRAGYYRFEILGLAEDSAGSGLSAGAGAWEEEDDEEGLFAEMDLTDGTAREGAAGSEGEGDVTRQNIREGVNGEAASGDGLHADGEDGRSRVAGSAAAHASASDEDLQVSAAA